MPSAVEPEVVMPKKLSRDQIERILARDMPDHKLVEMNIAPDTIDHYLAPDAHSDLKRIHAKYARDSMGQKEETERTRGTETEPTTPQNASDDQVVIVEPKSVEAQDTATSRPRGPGRKAVVISAEDERVKGMQG